MSGLHYTFIVHRWPHLDGRMIRTGDAEAAECERWSNTAEGAAEPLELRLFRPGSIRVSVTETEIGNG